MRQPLLGKVEQQVTVAQAEMAKALRIGDQQLRKVQVAGFHRVRAQLLPDFFIGQRHGSDFLLPQPGSQVGADFGVREAILDVRHQVTQLAAAIVGTPLHAAGLHRHFGDDRVSVDFDMLMEVFEKDGVTVEEGDFFLFHTGWDDMILSMNGDPDADKLHNSGAVLNGFDDRLLEWITDSGVVALISDNMAIEDPSGYGDTQGGCSRLPIHRHCLFRLGVHLGEIWYLSELAEDEDLTRYASQVGIDEGLLQTCLASGRARSAVDADLAAAQSVGVTGTPAFIVNGILLSGLQSEEAFDRLIQAELARRQEAGPARN